MYYHHTSNQYENDFTSQYMIVVVAVVIVAVVFLLSSKAGGVGLNLDRSVQTDSLRHRLESGQRPTGTHSRGPRDCY